MAEGTLEKHASLEYLRAGKYGQKQRGIKDCVENERRSRVPALLEIERSHITKAEIRQKKK